MSAERPSPKKFRRSLALTLGLMLGIATCSSLSDGINTEHDGPVGPFASPTSGVDQ